MSKYITRTTEIAVAPEDSDLYDERVTRIAIEDEGAGEFVVVKQTGAEPDSKLEVRIDPDEWAFLKPAIQRMIDECNKYAIEPEETK
jgi:hypothetical protein